MSQGTQEDFSCIMGVQHVMGTGKYLGLPFMIDMNKSPIFVFIKNHIWKKINS